MKKLILCFLILSSIQMAEAKRKTLFLTNFFVGAIRYTPQIGGTSVFIQGGWSPVVEIGAFAVRGELGFSSSRNILNDRFLTSNYKMFLMIPFGSIFFGEVGAGLETWHSGNGGTNPIYSLGVVARVAEMIDRLYIMYSRCLLKGNGTNIITAGYAFNF